MGGGGVEIPRTCVTPMAFYDTQDVTGMARRDGSVPPNAEPGLAHCHRPGASDTSGSIV